SARRASRQRRSYALQPGQYYWIPQTAPDGPVVAIVNLHTQMVQVFRNGVVIAFSSASTGKPGYGTPSGVFSILEKRRHHRSSTYDNAPCRGWCA
ncbi:MAG: L,D-transpeptidase family protein, partial [Brachymonas sp.]|nr:L,D-transpeptidase family protein [Brachymonas sp.]